MPISQTDQLFGLIKSLSKAEKRNFRLYVNRLQSNDSTLFLKLFDAIDKKDHASDDILLTHLGNINKTQYSNLKRHLYTQIVVSLRMIHKSKRSNIQVREYIDFAYILYGKGLYLQALKLLSKAKKLATKNHLSFAELTIIEFEKVIHSRHITRSEEGIDKELMQQADDLNEIISSSVKLSNLRIRLHGKYIRYGHVKSKEEENELITFFNSETKDIVPHILSIKEQVFLMQSYVWYYYILLDFKSCFDWAEKWVNLLIANEEMLWRDVDLFMRGYHYIITSLFNLKDDKNMTIYLNQIETFRKQQYKKLNTNSKIISFLYTHSGRLNEIILSGDFDKGNAVIPKSLKRINLYKRKLDDHRILVFYYKFAWIYLGQNKPKIASDYLSKIVNQEFKNLREDLQGYSRLLYLICQYEMENEELMIYDIKRFNTYFKKENYSNKVQKEIFFWLKKLANAPVFERKELFLKFELAMLKLEKQKYEKRAFVYLDIVSWIKTKTLKKPLSEIVAKKL